MPVEDDSDWILTFAHDLRQPLRTIAMHAQSMQRRDAGANPETQTSLAKILASVREQEDLIASVVEFNLAERNGLESMASPMPLDLAIQAACLKVEGYRKQCDGVIQFERTDNASISVPGGISKVVEKVVHNAIKFRPKGTCPQVRIDVDRDPSNQCMIRIRDFGLGIEPQHREIVFEPFRKLNAASEYPGCGMGLAICSRMMTAMGGKIYVEENGQEPGTTVIISLPLD